MNRPQVKQWIVVREDLGISTGKLCAQAAHVSLKTFLSRMSEPEKVKVDGTDEEVYQCTIPFTQEEIDWINDRHAKITCRVSSLNALMKIYSKAQEAGLTVELIKDAGLTELDEPTYTALAIGPHHVDKASIITKRLQVLK